jgi:tripartite-type tricarboxylate transporter receptor subunit TctC
MLFRKALGVDLTTVPFQGTAPALNALLGGQVDILCDQTTQTMSHIKGGTVKLYGVTTRERVKILPDTPTLDEVDSRASRSRCGTASMRRRARRSQSSTSSMGRRAPR